MLPKQNENIEEIPAWLTNAISEFDKDGRKSGDILSHEWIKWALNIPAVKKLSEVDDIQWILLQRVEAFKDYLLKERKIALRTIRGKGYYIVPPSEQAQFAVEEAMRLVRKGLDKGDKILDYARIEEMDNESAKRHTDTQIRMCGIRGIMTKQRRNIFQLFAPEN